MSFSFSITAATKSEAIAKVAAQLDSVVESQPVHAADQVVALDAATRSVDVLVNPGEGEAVHVSVSGSLGWRGEGEFTSANISVSTSIRAP